MNRDNTPEVIALTDDLVDKIISTCEVEYSEEAPRHKVAAETKAPDTAYSQEKFPLDWSEYYSNLAKESAENKGS